MAKLHGQDTEQQPAGKDNRAAAPPWVRELLRLIKAVSYAVQVCFQNSANALQKPYLTTVSPKSDGTADTWMQVGGVAILGFIERSETVGTLGVVGRKARLQEWRAYPPVYALGDGGLDSVAWLRRQSPAEWHELVKGYTWESDDLSLMICIADQPNADRATILAMLLDLDVTYYEGRKSLGGDPRAVFPNMTALLDRIEAGFAKGYYQSADFGLVRDRSQLERTTAYLARLGRAPIWALPARTWDALQGRGHKPRYVYDAHDEAFRMPFDQWARHRVAPN